VQNKGYLLTYLLTTMLNWTRHTDRLRDLRHLYIYFFQNKINRLSSDKSYNEKNAQRRRKHCALAVVRPSQKNSPRRRPLPEGAGRPKFNQLEMVTTFTYTFGEDRCTTQFRVIVVTDPHTNTHTHKQTGPITIHCAAAIARSVIMLLRN